MVNMRPPPILLPWAFRTSGTHFFWFVPYATLILNSCSDCGRSRLPVLQDTPPTVVFTATVIHYTAHIFLIAVIVFNTTEIHSHQQWNRSAQYCPRPIGWPVSSIIDLFIHLKGVTVAMDWEHPIVSTCIA